MSSLLAVSRNVNKARWQACAFRTGLIRQAGSFRHFYSGPALGRPRGEATTTLPQMSNEPSTTGPPHLQGPAHLLTNLIATPSKRCSSNGFASLTVFLWTSYRFAFFSPCLFRGATHTLTADYCHYQSGIAGMKWEFSAKGVIKRNETLVK